MPRDKSAHVGTYSSRWRLLGRAFAGKLVAATLGVSVLGSLAGVLCMYVTLSRQHEAEFTHRYQALGAMAAASFQQFEKIADSQAESALYALLELMRRGPLPDDAELRTLARNLGIDGFYVIREDGRFIRSSTIAIEEQTHSFFDFCEEYRGFLNSSSTLERTPILPGDIWGIPSKYIFVPSADRKLILEAGMRFVYLAQLLHSVIASDPHILEAELLAPNGRSLGAVGRQDAANQGPGLPEATELSTGKSGDADRVLTFSIPSTVTTCCECKVKGTGIDSGPYNYALHLKVSTAPLNAQLATLKGFLGALFLCTCFLTFCIARAIVPRLVAHIDAMSDVAQQIVDTGNLDLRVKVPAGQDEVSRLATAFNGIVDNLAESRTRLVQTAHARSLAQVAAEVAHDIRSPLAALEAVLKMSTDLPEDQRGLIQAATGRIKDIANNLLKQHRGQANSATALQPEPVVRMVETLLAEVRARYRDREGGIDLDVETDARDVAVAVEKHEFSRVLCNLINNAVEASPTTRPVHVSVQARGKDVSIGIRDHGSGIAADKIPSILRGGVTTKATGTGIGLSSSARRAEEWGGKLILESEVGKGTTVTLFVPMVRAA